MHCQIIAVGNKKIPPWCELACDLYLTRLQHFLKCTLSEIPCALRHKTLSVSLASSYKEAEGQKILQKISGQDIIIALDVKGQSWSTLKLSEKINSFQQTGKNLCFLIGGPDGLSDACLTRADIRWSLSELTFPHALVRVLLLEQLYRAWSLLANHPYHRE